jgi:hypothetical protein
VYGHHHLNTANLDAQKKFLRRHARRDADQGGHGNTEIVRFPNVLIFFRATQAPTGGTRGTTVNHIGFSVPNLRQMVDKVKANGFKMITVHGSAGAGSEGRHRRSAAAGRGARSPSRSAPDDVKVEFLGSPQQTIPITLHHVHFFNPKNSDMREWYVKTFGAKPRKRAAPSRPRIFPAWR